jgi:hypothetical protein
METQTPIWATDKIKEGMKAFLKIADEYGQFEVTFKQLTFYNDIGFDATVSWNPFARPDITHKVEFSVHYNFEQLFNANEEKINTWQFVFEDSGFRMNGQLFYMELFQHLDKKIGDLIKMTESKITKSDFK